MVWRGEVRAICVCACTPARVDTELVGRCIRAGASLRRVLVDAGGRSCLDQYILTVSREGTRATASQTSRPVISLLVDSALAMFLNLLTLDTRQNLPFVFFFLREILIVCAYSS
jgi:hypothetical protein